MQSQPNHIEIVCEKNTVEPIVRTVAADYCIPVTSGRGYCSLPPRNVMAQRYQRSGKEKLVLLLLSDFDPDGEEIAHSFARSMRDDFAVADVHAIKVGYATESELRQMERDLPLLSPAMFALASSSGKWRLAQHLAYLDRALTSAIEDAAAGRLDGLVVSMPPQHGKSELCSKYPPAWYPGTYPDRRVILTSYEADFAGTWGRKARDLLERWGRLFRVRVSKRSSAVIAT